MNNGSLPALSSIYQADLTHKHTVEISRKMAHFDVMQYSKSIPENKAHTWVFSSDTWTFNMDLLRWAYYSSMCTHRDGRWATKEPHVDKRTREAANWIFSTSVSKMQVLTFKSWLKTWLLHTYSNLKPVPWRVDLMPQSFIFWSRCGRPK